MTSDATPTRPSALICGAGIAGCAMAIGLARLGWSVRLIDRQAAWHFQSSGIFVYSNGLSHFSELGVMEDMVASGFVIANGRNVYLHADGSPLAETFYPSRYAGQTLPPILGIRRAEMHRVLSAQLARLGVQVQLATTVQAIDRGRRDHLERRGTTVMQPAAGRRRDSLTGARVAVAAGAAAILGLWRLAQRAPPPA
jgi:2-polyprenyl-6-methoxyphenol hydroxylase-like FAD-dependent oxidoreductase